MQVTDTEVWIAGAMEIDSGMVWMTELPAGRQNLNIYTMTHVVTPSLVMPNSSLSTDSSHVYSSVALLGQYSMYKHFTVNHSQYFTFHVSGPIFATT